MTINYNSKNTTMSNSIDNYNWVTTSTTGKQYEYIYGTIK